MPTPTLDDLPIQSRRIADYVLSIRQAIATRDVIDFYHIHPDAQQSLLSNPTASTPNIIYGFREMLDTKGLAAEPSRMPSREDISYEGQDWLQPGDVIMGWVGFLVDYPREILSYTESGYTWQFLNGGALEPRDPVIADPYFQDRGWHRFGNASEWSDDQAMIDAIHQAQETEEAALNDLLTYFRQKQYRE